MEPQQRRRLLIWIVNGLRVTLAETIRCDCWIAVAITRYDSVMQMCYHAHFIAERRQTGGGRKPVGGRLRKLIGVADIGGRAALREYRHPKRTRLPRETGAVVICPER